jgi:hypothetical protein
MTGLIAKLMAYARYPRRTFLLLHPIRAAKFGLAYLAGRRLFGDAKARRNGGKRGASTRHRSRPARRGARSGAPPRRQTDDATARGQA